MAKFDREYDKWQSTQEKIKEGSLRYDRKFVKDRSSLEMRLLLGIPETPRRNHTMKSETRYNGREEKRAKVRHMKQIQKEREADQHRLATDDNYGSW